MNVHQVLSQFQAQGLETCFHDRHINSQIYAGLNGRNWSLKEYEARAPRILSTTSCGRSGRRKSGC